MLAKIPFARTGELLFLEVNPSRCCGTPKLVHSWPVGSLAIARQIQWIGPCHPREHSSVEEWERDSIRGETNTSCWQEERRRKKNKEGHTKKKKKKRPKVSCDTATTTRLSGLDTGHWAIVFDNACSNRSVSFKNDPC